MLPASKLATRYRRVCCATRAGGSRRDLTLLCSASYGDAFGDVEGFIDWGFAYRSHQTRYQHDITNHTSEIDGDTAGPSYMRPLVTSTR